jgi:hypothetical protein
MADPRPAAELAKVGMSAWAELAYYKQGGPCPYRSHRSSDWLNDAGQWVCGICHPPVARPAGIVGRG